MPKHKDGDPASTKDIKKFFSAYLEQISAIVWRIDIVGNEISFLNSYTISTNGEKVRSILQNPQLAKRLVLAEDRERFQNSYDQIRKRIRTACVFRLRLDKGATRWFKIIAMPDPENQTCSIGLLMDITSHVDTVLTTEGRPTLSNRIDLVPDPVLLVKFSDRSICATNKSAEKLLQYHKDQLLGRPLQELLQDTPKTELFEIYEALIFSDRWNGELHITDSCGESHQCSARIQAVSRDEENLLWITLRHLNDCPACKGIPVQGNEIVPPQAITKTMRKCTTVRGLLKTMLKALPKESATDAIMLSRIFSDKNIVAVTGVGEPFAKMPENRTHPYEGSIAENIVRFDLEKHVVMETSKSIKPIDWALFIPHGIRSYYAQPFFKNGTLAYVLIFCSTSIHTFDPDADAPMLALHEEFIANLQRCNAE